MVKAPDPTSFSGSALITLSWYNVSHSLQSMEHHIGLLAELSWIFAYLWSLLTPGSSPEEVSHSQKHNRVSISVLKKTCSIFNKATFYPQNPHNSPEPLAFLPWNSLEYAILPFFPDPQRCGVGRMLLCSLSSTVDRVASVLSNSHLILLILPILQQKRPRHLSEDGRALLGWGPTSEGTKPVKSEPLERTLGIMG